MIPYVAFCFECPESQQDTLVSQLSAYPFDGYEQLDNQLKAYAPESSFEQIKTMLAESHIQNFTIEWVPAQNWNASWEENYQPIEVDDFCEIIATFHQATGNKQHVLKIQPQMSFGTGHHATTRSMIRQMRKMNFQNLEVLDMGAGTGILGILALKLGAKSCVMIDIESWAAENCLENCELNEVQAKSICGSVEDIPNQLFDVILANINKNILLQDGEQYVKHIKKYGFLLISGFFDFDKPIVENHFQTLGLKTLEVLEENAWICILFQKQ